MDERDKRNFSRIKKLKIHDKDNEEEIQELRKRKVHYRADFLRELEKLYIGIKDWEVHENANVNKSFGGYLGYLLDKMLKTPEIISSYLPEEAVWEHFEGSMHIHKLPNSLYIPYCAGWSISKILKLGLRTPTVNSNPAKHLDTAISHLVNYFFLAAQEWTGAQAVTAFDLYMAPFVKQDNLDSKGIKQALQRLVFELNYPTRMGYQSPFTNVTVVLDTAPDFLEGKAIVGGKEIGKLGDYFDEALMVNKALFELYLEGDAKGQPFTFPIVTVMLTKNFDWNGNRWGELTDLFFRTLAKRGSFYLLNGHATDVSALYAMCLHPDEFLLVKNDNTIKILKSQELENYIGEPEGKGWFKVKKRFLVLSFNKETYKIEWIPVKRILKIRSREITTIRTKDGRTIRVTPNHPVIVFTHEGFKIKFAKDIRAGDLIPIVKKAANILKKDYVYINGLGKVDEDLAYIVGLFVAEGNYLRLTKEDSRRYRDEKLIEGYYYKGIQFSLNKNEQHLIKKIQSFFKDRFDKDVIIKEDPRYPNNVYLYVYSHDIAVSLRNNGIRGDANKKKIPWFIWNSPKSVIEAFIKGIYDGDGYKKGMEIHLNNPILAKEIALLTQIIGLHTTIRIRKNSQTIRFVHVLGRGSKKQLYIRDTLFERIPHFLIKRKRGMSYHDGQYSVSIIDKYNAWTPEAKRIYESDISLIPVEEVTTRKLQNEIEFYDIELEDNHLFVHSLGTITHNCCRLTIDTSKFAKNGNGLFKLVKEESEEIYETLKKSDKRWGIWAMPEATGSIGVVTLNLPRLAIEANGDIDEFYDSLYNKLEIARTVLLRWRERYEKTLRNGFMPLTRIYLGHFNGHFNTLGVLGLPEAAINLLGDPNIWYNNREAAEAIKIMKDIVAEIRKVGEEFENEDGYLYNVEEVPGESASFRLALQDYNRFHDLVKEGQVYIPIYMGKPFYSNSVVPYYVDVPISRRVEWEAEVQQEFTGGVMLHLFMHEAMDPYALKKLVYNIVSRTKIVYFSITPSISVCNDCGWRGVGIHFKCPKCGSSRVDIWSRIVGYYRPIRSWNDGKKAEFYFRVHYGENKNVRPIDIE